MAIPVKPRCKKHAGKQCFLKTCAWCKGKFYSYAPRAKFCKRQCFQKFWVRQPSRRAKFREWTRLKRLRVLKHYGNKCACCGIKTFEFLAVHHLKGGGTKHRMKLKMAGNPFTAWLIRNNFPKGFGILCHNCNAAKGHYGYCPHEKQ